VTNVDAEHISRVDFRILLILGDIATANRLIIRNHLLQNWEAQLEVTFSVRVIEHKSSRFTDCDVADAAKTAGRQQVRVPDMALDRTTAVLIERGLLTAEDSFGEILEGRGRGGAIAAMSRIMGTTTKNWIREKPRSRVRSALGRSGCAVVLMAEIHSWRWRKKKGRKRSFLPCPKASFGVSCR